ncbi:MAG: hypothetical protein LBV31_01565 [Prevotellaceae bacterium]|nr:hypothetical protein [Prevotellaceae bacterium]
MQVSPENVPVGSDNVVLIVTNNTSKEITYSIYFTLDYFDGTNWMPIELDIAFEDLRLAVPAGKSIEKEIFLWPEYHDYKIGKYRITKEFPINNERRNICAEFEITP